MSEPRLCECGCGQPTLRVNRTIASRGLAIGDPQRFIRGHKRRTGTRYYPTSDGGRTHRVRAGRALGRPLPKGAEVHHFEEVKTDPNGVLVICEGRSYHFFLHARMRVKRAGGDPNKDKICGHCKEVKAKDAFNRNSAKYDGLNNDCRDCTRAALAAYRQ